MEEPLGGQSGLPTFSSMRNEFVTSWEKLKGKVKTGAPDRSRTCNLLIRSQVLYPLSYGRIRCVIKNYGESVKEVEDANIKCLKGNLPRAYQLQKSYCTVSSSQVSFTPRAFHNCQVSTPPLAY